VQVAVSEPPPVPPTLARQASRAFVWSILNTVVSRFGPLAIGIVLARVLGPNEFGVFAVAMVSLVAVLSFNELGVSLAIVRWREEPDAIAPTVNAISVAASALLTGLLVVTAPWISTALGDVRATPVVQVMAISILISGIVASPAAVLQRRFMQKERMIIDQVSSWLGAILSLVCALAGLGAMSLAIGRIGGSLAAAVLFLRWSPIPYRFGWDRRVARHLFSFGLPLAASSAVLFASGYADQVVTGSRLGSHALGFYLLAFNLASWPVAIFSQPLRSVAPATFARLQGDPLKMSAAMAGVVGVLSAVALPTCALISGASRPIVGFIYGTAWLPAAAALAWLAGQAALRIWFELAYDYLVVLGRSKAVLLIQLCWFLMSVPALLVSAHYFGMPGVAAAQFVVSLVVVLPLYAGVLHRSGIRIGALAKAVGLPLGASLGLGAAVWWTSSAVSNVLLACLISGVLALGVLAALLLPRRQMLMKLWHGRDNVVEP